jgi:hypothetical protein
LLETSLLRIPSMANHLPIFPTRFLPIGHKALLFEKQIGAGLGFEMTISASTCSHSAHNSVAADLQK